MAGIKTGIGLRKGSSSRKTFYREDWMQNDSRPQAGRKLILARRLSPSANGVLLARLQLGIAMEQQVLLVGHLVLLDLLADVLQRFLALLGVVIAPLRKIHVLAPVVYIAGDDPRHRRHVAVP